MLLWCYVYMSLSILAGVSTKDDRLTVQVSTEHSIQHYRRTLHISNA